MEMLFDLRGYSDAKYGRTYHTHSSDNLRLFPRTARGSEVEVDLQTLHVH